MRWKFPRPSSQQLRVLATRLLWLFPILYALHVMALVLAAPGPQVMAIEGDVRFGLDEEERRDIYAEIARYRRHWGRVTTRTFPNHDWSRHDDFANHVRRHVLMLADRYGLHRSEVFMIYDEGVRRHWTGPDGQTMPVQWAPLQPRTQ